MSIALEHLISSWEISPQADSPLFNGTIPTEIRLEIFRYALTPWVFIDRTGEPGWDYYWDHDFRIKESHDGDPDEDIPEDLEQRPDAPQGPYTGIDLHFAWFRPGCRGRPVLSTNLLAACRLVFVEARLLFFENQRFWWLSTSPMHPRPRPDTSPGPWFAPGFGGAKPLADWSVDRIRWEHRFKSVHIFGHPGLPSVLNHNYLFKYRRPSPLLGVEHLRITNMMCGMDGTFPVTGQAIMCINPFGDQDDMPSAMELSKGFTLERALREDDGSRPGRPSWMPPGLDYRSFSASYEAERPWGLIFVNLPRLKMFTFDFDMFEYRRDEMEKIVEWAARTWQLPLNPNINGGYHYLSADGNPIERMSWRGSNISWGTATFDCNDRGGTKPRRNRRVDGGGDAAGQCECDEHRKRRLMLRKGFGPRMYTWTVMWTRRRHHGPEVYPYGGAIEVAEDDLQSDEYIEEPEHDGVASDDETEGSWEDEDEGRYPDDSGVEAGGSGNEGDDDDARSGGDSDC